MKAKISRLCAFAWFLVGMTAAEASAQSISIQEVETLTYPTIAVTSGSSVNLTISPLNSATSGSGQIISGTASRGQVALSLGSGGTPVSISVDISDVNTGNSGLTLDDFSGFYSSQLINSFPSSTLPLPALSPASTPLYLGATVTANSTVQVGHYNASLTITVFVQ